MLFYESLSLQFLFLPKSIIYVKSVSIILEFFLSLIGHGKLIWTYSEQLSQKSKHFCVKVKLFGLAELLCFNCSHSITVICFELKMYKLPRATEQKQTFFWCI